MKKKLILSLGSNIDPRDDNLKEAVLQLNNVFHLEKLSSVYKTAPMDDLAQEYFYNICAIYTSLCRRPIDILQIVKDIEKGMGRVKDDRRPKGPRNIDIDILFFGEVTTNWKDLTIPHKSMFERRFVLEPLIEILPKNSKYIKKYKLIECLSRCMNQEIIKMGELKYE